MLSNAYFLANFRFDSAENEPAKNLQNLQFCEPCTADGRGSSATASLKSGISFEDTRRSTGRWPGGDGARTSGGIARAVYLDILRLGEDSFFLPSSVPNLSA